ncbi:hypothetical protein [Arenibaculum pallidiluteum]|uniref:hypothetical protein n=1 Tax=Arenibaculum pallidiluteum TaxID=2812559 RepID=UPI0038B3C5C0
MRERRHHNRDGRQIKRGKTAKSLRQIAKRLRLPFNDGFAHGEKPASKPEK